MIWENWDAILFNIAISQCGNFHLNFRAPLFLVLFLNMSIYLQRKIPQVETGLADGVLRSIYTTHWYQLVELFLHECKSTFTDFR